MSTLATIIQELIALLSNANLAGALSTAASIATQILALLGNKYAERDIQSQDAYNAALLGSVSAAQWLYHNSQGNGMPHEDIVDGQFYWAKLVTAGWTVVNGTVVAPSAPPPVQ
jgi:hypothetical protein